MVATVVVVGGGYGGITAAQALDDDVNVVLVDPKDCFVHNVASLRAVVDPAWAPRMFLPYEGALKRGRVVRDWVVAVEQSGVWLSSGKRLAADYVIAATGTTYPFPAKHRDYHGTTAVRRLHITNDALRRADRVLLLGAGAVGLELAGEITAAWPEKTVTIIDPAPEILSSSFIEGFRPDLANRMRSDLLRQLHEAGVQLLLGDSVAEQLRTESGRLDTFTVPTRQGRSVTADIWFSCYGRKPATRSLAGSMSYALRQDSLVRVTPHLRVSQQYNVFAIGDIASVPVPDTAVIAIEQGELVAEHIRTLIGGGRELKPYEPSQPFFLVPLGPKGGASYSPDAGILDAQTTSMYKGTDLLIGKYNEMFGLSDN